MCTKLGLSDPHSLWEIVRFWLCKKQQSMSTMDVSLGMKKKQCNF